MFDRLGRLILRLRFAFVGAWIVGAIAFGILGPSLSAVGSADEGADRLLAERRPDRRGPGRDRRACAATSKAAAIPTRSLRYVTAESSPSLASMFRSQDGVVELAQCRHEHAVVPAAHQRRDRRDRAHLARRRPAGRA
jgi:hypothetical protein